MPLTIDDVPKWFFCQVLKNNMNVTGDDIIKAYEEQQGKQTNSEYTFIGRIVINVDKQQLG